MTSTTWPSDVDPEKKTDLWPSQKRKKSMAIPGFIVHVKHGKCICVHYANMSMQYTAIFHGCKNDNFQMKILIVFLFLLKTALQEMCCGFLLSREMWYRKSVLPGTGAG